MTLVLVVVGYEFNLKNNCWRKKDNPPNAKRHMIIHPDRAKYFDDVYTRTTPWILKITISVFVQAGVWLSIVGLG